MDGMAYSILTTTIQNREARGQRSRGSRDKEDKGDKEENFPVTSHQSPVTNH
jgi:hypothetical protein